MNSVADELRLNAKVAPRSDAPRPSDERRQNGERLLAAVDFQAGSQEVLRWAQKRADDLGNPWIAVYVQTAKVLTDDDRAQLTINLALARELGAEVVTVAQADTVAGLLRAAGQRSITEIVVGTPSTGSWWSLLQGDVTLRRLIRASRGKTIHVLPLSPARRRANGKDRLVGSESSTPQYLTAIGAVIGVTVAAFFFTPIVGAHATALVFLLAVVFLALIVRRGPTMAAAALSALSWDYFFLPPTFAFRIQHFEDAMLFGMYFVVALVLGQLTARIRAQQEAERRREERATALFLLTRELGQAADLDHLAEKIVQQVESVFDTKTAFVVSDPLRGFKVHSASSWRFPEDDREIVTWVFQHGQAAGRFTRQFKGAAGMYVPLAGLGGPAAALGLDLSKAKGFSIHQQNLLEDFAHQISLALDRQRLNQISEKARLLAESERLSKTLLDSMSHEMRTPIAAIRGATGTLLQVSAPPTIGFQQEMLAEIEEATERLDRLVGNVLEASRLESGAVRPRLNECDVKDLIHVSIAETERQLARHRLVLQLAPELPLVRLDFVLMQQVITNLLSNAAFHTPVGSTIELSAQIEEGQLVVVVSDNGPGISPSSLPRVFDKFYRAPNAPAGGTGLGLSLVKGFVEAHGGTVKVENRPGSGAAFTLCLPAGATSPQERMLS